MIFAILILLFFAFSIGVFFISNWWILLGIAGIQVLAIFVLRVSVFKAIRSLLLALPFVLMLFGFNMIWLDLEHSASMAARLLIMCNMTFIFMTAVTFLGFIKGLRFFMGRRIAVMIAVGVAFIPLLRDEYLKIRQAMNAKGKRKSLRITFQVVMYKVLYRAGQLSQTLEAKGFK
ncbi:MAG: energy-coupling factor transporter transmembrane protein EcfT [Firmicutes bacterium]|nr:energy-coupling factor transporter transmembrane protein EcfT [Bacillota bacterium]